MEGALISREENSSRGVRGEPVWHFLRVAGGLSEREKASAKNEGGPDIGGGTIPNRNPALSRTRSSVGQSRCLIIIRSRIRVPAGPPSVQAGVAEWQTRRP